MLDGDGNGSGNGSGDDSASGFAWASWGDAWLDAAGLHTLFILSGGEG